MLPEDLFEDFEKVVGFNLGNLEAAMRTLDVSALRALPRYARSRTADADLIRDIEAVIEGIESDGKSHTNDEFRRGARSLFLLDLQNEYGETMTDRQKAFAGTNGPGPRWMHRAVFTRVAHGLFALDAGTAPVESDPVVVAEDGASGYASGGAGFRLDRVHIDRYSDGRSHMRRPCKETLTFELTVLGPGPHVVTIPGSERGLSIVKTGTEQATAGPEPTIQTLRVGQRGVCVLIFGVGQRSGERAQVTLERVAQPGRWRRGSEAALSPYTVCYQPDIPVGALTLSARRSGDEEYLAQLTQQGPLDANPMLIDGHPIILRNASIPTPRPQAQLVADLYGGSWTASGLTIGTTYTLTLHEASLFRHIHREFERTRRSAEPAADIDKPAKE